MPDKEEPAEEPEQVRERVPELPEQLLLHVPDSRDHRQRGITGKPEVLRAEVRVLPERSLRHKYFWTEQERDFSRAAQ